MMLWTPPTICSSEQELGRQSPIRTVGIKIWPSYKRLNNILSCQHQQKQKHYLPTYLPTYPPTYLIDMVMRNTNNNNI